MINFFHISDLHFGRVIDGYESNSKRLLESVNKFCKTLPEGYWLLLTGDVTDSGTDGQYKDAYEALKPFTDRTLLVPGNHDFDFEGILFDPGSVARFNEFAQSLGMKHDFTKKCVWSKQVDDKDGTRVLITGLDSTTRTLNPFDFSSGEIGTEQLAQLDKILGDPLYSDCRKIVCLHHRPYGKDFLVSTMELKDKDKLVKVIKGRVDVLAFGHQGGQLKYNMTNRQWHMVAKGLPASRLKTRAQAPNLGVKFDLDADNAVEMQSMFWIKVDKGNVDVVIKSFRRKKGVIHKKGGSALKRSAKGIKRSSKISKQVSNV